MKKKLVAALAVAVIAGGFALKSCNAPPALSAEQQALVAAAKQDGATDVQARKLDDGGLLLEGKLEGLRFVLDIPWRWNHQTVLVAYGYRPPGFPTIIPDNPLADDSVGFHRLPYREGFLTGRSEYAKAGMGVQTGAQSTYRLKQLTDKLGSTHAYLMGASMGGNITMALIEKHPQDFAGAISWCGAVGGWEAELAWTTDVRAVHGYFTRGTPYALPGEQSIAKSAVGMPPEGLPKWVALPLALAPAKRVTDPVMALFRAARKNPAGEEAKLIERIALVTGIERDPASLLQPLSIMALGMDDLNEVWGGSIYDNSAKVYSSPLLSVDEAKALNAGIERIRADPAAVARAREWYQPTGHFETRLLTVFNQIDPTVPYRLHEAVLREAVQRAGNLDHLAQRMAPSMRDKLPGAELDGYVHCGFTPDQAQAAWTDLRAWVETGKKPEETLP